MKLAYICTEMLPCPAIKGGAIQILIDGVAPILARKHELKIFCITDPDLPKREKIEDIEYIRIRPKKYVAGVAEELAKHHFDVVHVFNRPINVHRYKSASPESKFVLSLHNEMFAKEKITTTQGEKAIQSVEKLMTVSNFIGKTVTTRFPSAESKVKTVYSGADLSAYVPKWSSEAKDIRDKLRKKYGLKGKKVILFVGRLSVNKGPHILIQSMKHVLDKKRDTVLVIAGSRWFSDDSMNDYVTSLYRLAAPYGKRIIFTKYIPADEIPKYYLIADIFVCSSQWQEPLARVQYEAMAAGLPIITTNRGGNAELIRHNYNGLVVKDYKNPREFAKAINTLLANTKEASRMAKNGRKMVEKKFQFDHVAERLENVYLEVL